MLHDRLQHSDAAVTSLAAQYYYHSPRYIASYQQFDNTAPSQRVNHVGLSEYHRQRHDVITPQCLYSQRLASYPTSSCEVLRPQSQTDSVISSRWPYINWHIPPATSEWVAPATTVSASSSSWCRQPDDRLFPYTTVPQSSFGPDIDQFAARYQATADATVSGCIQLDRRRSSGELTPRDSSSDVLPTTASIDNERLSTFSIASSSPDNDTTIHQFGSRPTRASTSIGKTRTREKYRSVYNERQKTQLEQQYIANTYISAGQKADIARTVGLTERQVKIWFQNRRAKDRRQKYLSCNGDLVSSEQDEQLQFGCLQF